MRSTQSGQSGAPTLPHRLGTIVAWSVNWPTPHRSCLPILWSARDNRDAILPIISYDNPHDINPPRHSLSGVEEFITPVEDTGPMVTYLKYDLFHNWLGLSGRVSMRTVL